ncbi:hypothetical protein GQX74_011594 [Glossina fuscipes]|nr:hypothetical protein GQX74_011594 [Glossina fuscipes]
MSAYIMHTIYGRRLDSRNSNAFLGSKMYCTLLIQAHRDMQMSLNVATSPGTSVVDIVASNAGSGSGATWGAKFAKQASSKNNYREVGCNKLADGRERCLYETDGLQTVNAKAQHHRTKQNLTQYGIGYDLLTMTRHALEVNKGHVKTV